MCEVDSSICTYMSLIKGVSGRFKCLIPPCDIQKYKQFINSEKLQCEEIYLRQCSPSHKKILENN